MGLVLLLVLAAFTLACRSDRPAARGTSAPAAAAQATPPETATAALTVSPTPTPGPIATATPATEATWAMLSAPSRNVLWASVDDQALFRSLDGGATWERRPLPYAYAGDVEFFDDREGLVFQASAPATQCQVMGLSIYHTSDAGATWRRLPATGLTMSDCKGPIRFVDRDHGFVGLWSPNHAPVIYRTVDGGETWAASAPLPDPPSQDTRTGSALRGNDIQRVGNVLLLTATGRGGTYVYRSTDGGATWDYLCTPYAINAGYVTFFDARRWWVRDRLSGVFITEDAGATWRLAPDEVQAALGSASQVLFVDENVGYVTFEGRVLRTEDGGAHWTRIRIPRAWPCQDDAGRCPP